VLSAQSKRNVKSTANKSPKIISFPGNNNLRVKRKSVYLLNTSKKPLIQEQILLLTERTKGVISAQDIRPLDRIMSSMDAKLSDIKKSNQRNKLKKILETQTYGYRKKKHVKGMVRSNSKLSNLPGVRSNSKDKPEERVVSYKAKVKKLGSISSPKLSASNAVNRLIEKNPSTKCIFNCY